MRSHKRITITVYPRMHISLIGMNKGGYRINGGAGFSVADPCLKVTSKSDQRSSLVDLRAAPFSTDEISRITSLLDSAKSKYFLPYGVSIELTGSIQTHSGFGSSTATRLACLESLFLHNNVELPQNELIYLSGRGGTSGVGINTYFNGGFAFDIGRKTDASKLLPSHGAEDRRDLPLTIYSIPAPEWEVGICVPRNIVPLTEQEESAFFESACPLDEKSVYEVNYHVSYGLLASILEADKDTFSLSVNNIQNCEWKKLERSIYGEYLTKVEQELYFRGATSVGMSSLGPCLYFMSKGEINLPDYQCPQLDSCNIYKTKINNNCRTIEIV